MIIIQYMIAHLLPKISYIIKYPDSQFILRTSFSPSQAMVLSSFVPADSRASLYRISHRFPCSAVSGSALFLLQNYFLRNFST